MRSSSLLLAKRIVRASMLTLLVVATLAFPTSAAVVVRDWRFDTPGDNEGWTAGSFQVNNLHVGASVDGTETVLTCDNLQNQADPKLYWPNEVVPMPAEAVSWDALTFRIRQIGDDGVTPAPFDSTGTIVMYGAGAVPTIAPIATATDDGVTVVVQADHWMLVRYDLSAYTGDLNAQIRMDPMAGHDVGGGVVLGNFEIDFITLTAATATTVTADAGADQVVTDEDDDGSEPVTLDGSGSSDQDGSIVSYTWAEDLATIATGVSPTVTMAVGSHLIELTATDDSGDADTDTVAVLVKPYTPPMTYYLDAVNGDDVAGDGSTGAPWQTLDKAHSIVIGGDTVVLASGNYGAFELVADSAGGWDLFGDWVVYKAADGADVEFERLSVIYTGVPPSDPEGDGFFNAYLRLEGIHILDGVEFQYAQHWALVDCLIENYGPWTGSAAIMDGKTGVYFRNVKDVLIEGCEVTNVVTGMAGNGRDIQILNNHIHDGSHDGLRVTGMWNALIEGNRIHGFDDGVTDEEEPTWSRHCDLIHIFIRGGGTEGMQNHNVVFRNNVLYDSEAQGVQFNNYYATIDTVHNEQILFENNIFGPVRANLFNAGDAVDGLVFRNNTVVVFETPRQFGRWTMANYNLRISSRCTGVQVYNNILGNGVPEAEADVQIFDYNLYQLPLNVEPSGVDGSRAFGRNALVGVDPMFVDPDAFDGALDPASPAINFGTRDFAPTPICEQDIAGSARDLRPDLGAWERPGQTPAAEPHAPIYDDVKTTFVENFADGHYIDVDPWLAAPNTQGMSWRRPDDVDFKFLVQQSTEFGGNALFEPLGDAVEPRTAFLFSMQGEDWTDYDFRFDAFNAYAAVGSGVLVLAHDRDNHYWLDISRDNGRLIRTFDGVQVELARDADIELPHVGLQSYTVSIRHGQAGEITISVDTNCDGSEDFSYTDADPAAIAAFGAGGVGFHTDVVNVYNRVHYDNIRVDVVASAGAAKPGDADGDGEVNIADFVILKNNFGKSPADFNEGDFNGDGTVDIADFVILKNNFGS